MPYDGTIVTGKKELHYDLWPKHKLRDVLGVVSMLFQDRLFTQIKKEQYYSLRKEVLWNKYLNYFCIIKGMFDWEILFRKLLHGGEENDW